MDRGGILPEYTGYRVHDRYASYFRYEHLDHSLCKAHLLRELKYLHEQEACAWAEEIKNLLLKAKQHKEQNPSVSKHYKTRIENQFQKIVHRHWRKEEKAMAAQSTDQVCRGKPKRSKAHNLLMALRQHQQAVLTFLREPLVPFDNNQAERDLHMIKTKQKVSGCFRSDYGGTLFCLIRGYLSTLRKNQQNILGGIQDALKGKPFMPIWNG
jgi:transposase